MYHVPMTPLEALLQSWMRSLKARHLSQQTRTTYAAAGTQLIRYLHERGVHTAQEITREHLQDWIGELLETRSAATASNRYRAVQQWFRWMTEEEEEIPVSPMARMRPPIVPEQDAEVCTFDQLQALVKVCEGRDYVSRRDMAIVRLFIDTGMRLSELAGLKVEDVDLDNDTAYVLGKGRRLRACPFGARTAIALDRYLRARQTLGKRRAQNPALWLPEKGPGVLLPNGIAQMLRRRGEQAGIKGLHPHMLRHTAASEWFAADGSEDAAMRLFGWKSRQMLHRYASATADSRAQAAHRRLALGDRL